MAKSHEILSSLATRCINSHTNIVVLSAVNWNQQECLGIYSCLWISTMLLSGRVPATAWGLILGIEVLVNIRPVNCCLGLACAVSYAATIRCACCVRVSITVWLSALHWKVGWGWLRHTPAAVVQVWWSTHFWGKDWSWQQGHLEEGVLQL